MRQSLHFGVHGVLSGGYEGVEGVHSGLHHGNAGGVSTSLSLLHYCVMTPPHAQGDRFSNTVGGV